MIYYGDCAKGVCGASYSLLRVNNLDDYKIGYHITLPLPEFNTENALMLFIKLSRVVILLMRRQIESVNKAIAKSLVRE